MAGSRLAMEKWLKKLLKGYRYALSPFFGDCCRFYPSCSEYAEEAILNWGSLRGGFLTVKRLLKCHPWCEGGVDLVPTRVFKNYIRSDR